MIITGLIRVNTRCKQKEEKVSISATTRIKKSNSSFGCLWFKYNSIAFMIRDNTKAK